MLGGLFDDVQDEAKVDDIGLAAGFPWRIVRVPAGGIDSCREESFNIRAKAAAIVKNRRPSSMSPYLSNV